MAKNAVAKYGDSIDIHGLIPCHWIFKKIGLWLEAEEDWKFVGVDAQLRAMCDAKSASSDANWKKSDDDAVFWLEKVCDHCQSNLE